MKINDNINKALRAVGVSQFTCKSCYDKNNAQQNLAGRTHYADDDTLRYFKARILRGAHRADGLLFLLVESVGSKPEDSKRNKRFNVFDVFGTVVNDREEWFATTDQAREAADKFLAAFDAELHTLGQLRCMAHRLRTEAHWIDTALAGREVA
jgi:hypothetical protein